MNKVTTTDILFFILISSWLADIQFDQLTILQTIGLVTMGTWLVLFFVKLILLWRRNRHA
jgi:hypothetical protein